MAVAEHAIGASVLRKEDPDLITGRGKYSDDIGAPGMLFMAMVRSPFAHAKVTRVDVGPAGEVPGVVAAYAGADLAGEWAGPLPVAWPVTPDMKNPPMYPLATDEVHYQGEGVAVVVAESRAAAEDGAEAVEVDYDPLPVVLDMEEAVKDGSPLVHSDIGTNASYTWTLSNGDVDKAFADAAIHVDERYVVQRQIPSAMEPRAMLVEYSPVRDEVTLTSSTQIPHIVRATLGGVVGIPESKIRVIAPQVGGGFGSKIRVSPEEALGVALARRLDRPIKWTDSRSGDILATHHGRDQIQRIELAADADGKILGYRIKLLANMGAYLLLVGPGVPLLGGFLYCGAYGGDAYHFECTGVFTNTTPTDAYRGAGRPEATYAIERAMDALARAAGKDPVEIRRINFVGSSDGQMQSPGGLSFDSGHYEAALDKALEMADYEGLRREQARRREAGDSKLLGIGFSTYIEMCGLAPSRVLGSLAYGAGGWDSAVIQVLPSGKAVVSIGITPHGQGGGTSCAQIAADDLGIPFDDIKVVQGDTAQVPFGMDTYGSRSMAVGGLAVHRACGKVVEKARKIAAHLLEVSEDDLDYQAGRFSVKGAPDRAKTIPELAAAAWTAHDLPAGLEPNLYEEASYDPENFVFPYGTHICVVEVDTETGETHVTKYVAVDDVGTVVNPMLVDGQVVGGVIQGIAEALFEEAVYDENGQLLTGSFTNYEVPAASEMPPVVTDKIVTPSTTNELGIKGVGETGTIACPPAVINAVVDALSHLGVTEMDRPASPERVWRAVRQAKANGGGAK